MDHSSDSFAAVLAIFCIFGLPMVWGIASRWMAHQERMAMISRGLTPPPDMGRFGRGRGMAPPPPPQPAAPTASPYEVDYYQWQANRMLYKGIVVGNIGFALLIGLSFINGFVGRPGPWLLGGLIPLFIGVAQIIIAVLSGAQLRGPGSFGGYCQAPPQAPHAEPPPPYTSGPRDVTPGSPFGWRPGATTELEKPPSPPRDPRA